MKILVLGAGGVIGQHLRLSIPPTVEAIFHRRTPSPGYIAADLTEERTMSQLLRFHRPDAVVNLAGESNTDYVESHAEACELINIGAPDFLARAAKHFGYHLIHISSQAVFSGTAGPYSPASIVDPVNEYGFQKAAADSLVWLNGGTIVRPTFILGIRPDPSIGRANPIEQMLGGQRKQVSDRWFSVSFAPDVAACIWAAAMDPNSRRIIHAGVPVRTSRYQIACDLGLDVEPVSHDSFPGLAPRPVDTTYSVGEYRMGYAEGLKDCLRRWDLREKKEAA